MNLVPFLRRGLFAALLCASTALPAWSQTAAAPAPATAASGQPAFQIRPVDEAWRAALPREAQAATQAWMDRLPADVVARSNSYFEGGYWLQLWNLLLGLAISGLLLWGRPSTAVRDWAQRRFKHMALSDAVYGAFFALVGWALALPLTIYQGFVREHAYGMATQHFGAWFGEQLTQLAVSLGVTAVLVALLYAAIRRAGERWWLWGTAVVMGLMCVGLTLGPLYIDPLFNTYKPVEEGPIKRAVLAMAQANGVPADNVYVFDASRQTTRVSANVSGLFGSAAVRLNDNLLRRSSEPEIRTVMAHEIGHYALNHIPKMLLQLGVLIAAGFMFSAWAMRRLLARFGTRWRVTGVGDVGTLPLLAAVFSAYLFVVTPVTNTLIRTQEVEADLWGLNLAREPMGEAEVLLKLVEYRKADPGPIEEFLFFDHPSTRTRIFNAMRWREQMLSGGAAAP